MISQKENPVEFSLYDSSEIKKIQPLTENERKVFLDQDLKYDQKAGVKQGFFDKLLDWLAEFLFGRTGYANINMARQIIIWSVVITGITLLIWLLSKSELISLIKPKPKSTSFNFSDITEDLNTINFNLKIAEALKQFDYRMAIRWQYLKILFMLDKKQIINFAPFKTNIDYSNELKGNNVHQGFIKVSRIYEYTWYGQFTLTEAIYKNNSLEFETIEKQINV